MQLKPIVIDNFSNIRPNGSFWVEGFYSDRVAGQRVMALGGQLTKRCQKGEADLAHMGIAQGFCEKATSGTDYVYFIDAGGYIHRASALTCAFAELHNVTFCTHGDIKAFTISGTEYLLYTSSRYLCRTSDDSSFTDDYQDLGALKPTWYRQIEIFLDTAYTGNGNYLASLSNIGVFSATGRQLPTDYDFRCMSANGDYMLISAESNSKGLLLLWDGVNTWSSILERANVVTAIHPYKRGWIFTEGLKMYYTDGFTVREMENGYLPDCETDLRDMTIVQHGLLILGNKILINGGAGGYVNRVKVGVWSYDMSDASWQFFSHALGGSAYASYGSTPGAMYFSSKLNRFLVAYSASIISNGYFISYLSFENKGSQDIGNMILPIVALEKEISFKHLILNILPNLRSYERTASPSLEITLKISDNKRVFWQYGQTNTAMAVKNKLQVDGSVSTYNGGEVGDEVLILEGVNAGCRRRITVVENAGTATEEYTLDSDMNGNTEDSVMFNILPFTFIEKKTLTDYTKNRFVFDLSSITLSGRAFIQLTVKQSYYSFYLTSIILQPSEVREDNI